MHFSIHCHMIFYLSNLKCFTSPPTKAVARDKIRSAVGPVRVKDNKRARIREVDMHARHACCKGRLKCAHTIYTACKHSHVQKWQRPQRGRGICSSWEKTWEKKTQKTKLSALRRSVLDVLPGEEGVCGTGLTGWNDTTTWRVRMNGWCPVRLWWQPNQRGSLHFTPHFWWSGAERAVRLTDVLHTLFIDLADCQAPLHHHTHTDTHTFPVGGKGCTEIVWKYESWGSKVTLPFSDILCSRCSSATPILQQHWLKSPGFIPFSRLGLQLNLTLVVTCILICVNCCNMVV